MAIKSYHVEVYEANAYAGGKLSQIKLGDYRFDAGPSLFTMPDLVDELFTLANKNPRDYFNYQKLPEVCRYFWNNGETLIADADIEKFDNEVTLKFGEKSGAVIEYLRQSDVKYNILNDLFLQDSLHKISTWTSKAAFKGYMNLGKLGIFDSLHNYNKTLFSNPKIIQLFDRYATYNGSDPYQTPATMGIIPHLEYNIGAYFPDNGMHDITKSLTQLAMDLGVKFHFNTKVSEIILEKKEAKFLKTDSEIFGPYDTVVSNMDVTPTYRKLLPHETEPSKILNQEKSGSGLIFYWGVNKEFKEFGLHNILFTDDYKLEFEHQFGKKTIYNDPTVYINISSKLNKKDAPSGCENWFVLINAPNDSGQNWEEIIFNTRESIINKVKTITGIDLRHHIVCEQILDPPAIQLKTSASQGALYGNSSNNKFAAFMRHPNFSKKIKNLYFVGGSVHPGGGIPLAISSAKIADKFLA